MSRLNNYCADMSKYIFRVNDICPEMDWEKFVRLTRIFDEFDIKPLLAVIPDNKDDSLKIDPPNIAFWQIIEKMIEKGYTLGMHGYCHVYVNNRGGLLGLHRGSEFAEIPFDAQLEKINKGKKILAQKGLQTEIFVAPGHSFDKNTALALKESGFKYISDGISLWPFENHGIVWLPQISGKVRSFSLGEITICIHPNNLTGKDFNDIENFIRTNRNKVFGFKQMIDGYKPRSGYNKILFDMARVGFSIIWYGSKGFSRLMK